MKKIKQLLLILNIASVAIVAAIGFASCQKVKFIDEPGYLVPKTADQDPSLPSISVNGTVLHSESFGDPNDPMVIYLHGGPGCDYQNALNITQLTDNGYYVVFYDQRGSGLSKRHDRETYTIQSMLDDLTAVIDHYRTSSTQKVFLFGHSWGAMLAAAYINAYPNSVQGVIFAEPGGFTDEQAIEYGQLIRQLDLLAETSNDVMYVDQFLTGNENDHELLDYKLGLAFPYTYAEGNSEGIEGPSPFWRKGSEILSHFLDIAMTEGFDFTQNLDQFAAPVLFIYGGENSAYGTEHAQKVSAVFDDVTLVEIENTGHEMIYFEWNSVYPVVLDYFNSLK